MDQGLSENIKVVIRSVRERTESTCIAAICAQGISSDEIEIIHKTPFAAALRSSFEVGLDSGCEWTFCVDADVILRPNSISTLVALAQKAPIKICELQGLMLDKFTTAIRAGGVHLYRTSLLHEAIGKIPKAEIEIRPETHVLHEMERLGYPWVTRPYVVGVHDFGQYFEDIYRKCYVHANKHLMHIPELLPRWKQRAETDSDFAVAIEGLVHGLRETGAIQIDKKLVAVADGFSSLGIPEKSDVVSSELLPSAIEDLLKTWSLENVPVHGFPVTACQAVSFGPDSRFAIGSLIGGPIRRKIKELGLLRAIAFIIGRGIERIGASIKRKSSGKKAA